MEGEGEARLPMREEVLEAGVGLLGATEACEHPHRPGPATMPRGVDAAGVREFTRHSQVALVVQVGQVRRIVDSAHGPAGCGREGARTLTVSAARFPRRPLLR